MLLKRFNSGSVNAAPVESSDAVEQALSLRSKASFTRASACLSIPKYRDWLRPGAGVGCDRGMGVALTPATS